MSEEYSKTSVLGKSYRQSDYSHCFNSMMNRVVTKIYLRRTRKKNINSGIICAQFHHEE